MGSPKAWKPLQDAPVVEFVHIVLTDFFKLALVWVLLYLFQLLAKYMPIAGFAGRCIEVIHQIGSVAVATLLVIFLIIDVIQSHREAR